jgi:hypothetical protein
MDNFQAVSGGLQKGGCCAATIGCLCCLAFTSAGVAFVSYLGIYALNNPDGPGVYGVTAAGVEGMYADSILAE